ncbi:MAG TPA: T9SS type A sorting domain-containing protein [Bacteroidales bacterium]|nr:T9SS type A sorting domain-containing protein [Bacteroidales bacterium]
MKKLLFFLTVFFSLTVVHGQTNVYHPFRDSFIWRVDYYYNNSFQYPCYAKYYFQYYSTGDTVINSYIHKKIHRSFVLVDTISCTNPVNPPGPPNSGYIGALRDDSIANKTFFVFPNTNIDSLLYDYNLVVDDTMKGFITQDPYVYNKIVLSVDSVLIDGLYRKRWNFGQCHNNYPYIIEGIGTSVGLIELLCSYAIDFTDRYLVCVKDSSSTLFASVYNSEMGCNLIVGHDEINIENSLICYPNPFSTKTNLQIDVFFKDATLTVYNSVGQQVKQINNISGQTLTLQRDNLPSGLYFMQLMQENKIIATQKLVITD